MEQEAAGGGSEEEQQEEQDTPLMYSIQRPVYNESLLRGSVLTRTERSTPSWCQQLAQHFRCSSQRVWALVLSLLPILTWLPSYPVKQYLFSDLVSGLSTGVVQLPQGLAYAMLAALPPVYGLYSSFYPVLLYTFFGTSRHISIGTFAVISLMVGGVVVREAPDSMFLPPPANGSNVSIPVLDVEARDARRVKVAVVIATLAGIIQVVLGMLRFGFVAIYLTEPLVRGFTTAAAVHVVVSQLKYLLGVKTQRYAGPLSALYSVRAVMVDITSTNVPSLLLGVACLLFLYGTKDINERFKDKLPIPVPGEIIVVMVSTGLSYGLSLSDHYQVDVVGRIPSGLVPPSVPDLSLTPQLITDSLAVAIVGFSMGISLAKIFALKHGYTVDSNQELIALGLCNFISSFFQTFAITCSMSRSLVQESTGGKTQIAGLLASLLVLLVVVAIGFVFQPLPQTALAAIIMVNLLGMFKQFRDLPVLWRTSRIELVIWLVAFVASVLLGLDYGLLVALTVALLTVLYRTQSPKTSVLGHVAGSGLYWDVEEYQEAVEHEGIKIFHFNSSIYFANSELYVSSLRDKVGVDLCPTRAVQKSPPTEKKSSRDHPSPLAICATFTEEAVTHQVVPPLQKNGGLQDVSEEVVFLQRGGGVHSVILDWTSVNFIDSVGAKAVKQVVKEYAAVEVRVAIAGCNGTVLSDLDRLQFFSGPVSTDLMFPTVHDAVLHCANLHCANLQPHHQDALWAAADGSLSGEDEVGLPQDKPWERTQRDIL